MAKLLSFLHPSKEHSAGSAAALLIFATMVSRVVGYLRDAYVAYSFGAGPTTDAYIAAFTLPDFLLYLFAGGAISVTFISLYTRYIAQSREADAQQVFNVIVTVLGGLFIGVIAVIEIFTPEFVHWWFRGFTPEQAELCVSLTRILLPQPVFFLIAGVLSAVLQTRRQFLIPAFAPIVYTFFIIAGGVLFGKQIGIASLAWGATVGAVLGPFLLNALGASKTGIGYSPSFDSGNPGFREWLKMSIPLMLGVSVVAADDWILRNFASFSAGDITRLNYAKRMLLVPIGILGQAVGLASLPFFSRLFSEGKLEEFERTVASSITRLAAASLLAASWMMACALPIIDIAFRRGRFEFSDSVSTAHYFFWFCVSLVFWTTQNLFARAFYAMGDMMRPMVAGTIVTAVSLPLYWRLFAGFGVMGLVAASNIAIIMHTVVLAVLLHARNNLKLGALGWGEIAKALLIAAVSGALGAFLSKAFPFSGSRFAGVTNLLVVSLTWGAAALAGLWLLKSELLQLLRRKGSRTN